MGTYGNVVLGKTINIGPERPLYSINSVVIHTTGWGAGLQRIYDQHKNNPHTMDDLYAKRLESVLKYKGHFLIGRTGTIYEVIPVDRVAFHTGGSEYSKLKTRKPPNWWTERWSKIDPEITNPTQLPSWKTQSPNSISIGIDLLAHGTVFPGYTDEQYLALTILLDSLHQEIDIDLNRKTVVGHEDLDWISRNGWDPGKKFDWSRVL